MQFRKKIAIPVVACSLGLVVGLAPAGPASAAVVGGPVLALAPGNQLLAFDAAAPGTITRTTSISGVLAGEAVVGIDIRPATGELFAVAVAGTTGHLYRLNSSNGVATAVNPVAFADSLPAGGTWSVDFNPVVDRIRFVHSTGASYRINQLNGTLAATDTPVTPAMPAALAYDRSTAAAPTATTLFAIDAATSSVNTIGGPNGVPSPNTGATAAVGALGVTVDAATVGFDVAAGGDALATLSVGGAFGLYGIDLASGSATLVGTVGAGTTPILDIALPRPPAGTIVALTPTNGIARFDAATPGTVAATVAITGVQPGETVVGFDVRPATGELIAVGVTGTQGRMYRLDPSSGAATAIGTTPFAVDLPSGGSWAVDVNPVPDRVRLVHSSGASYRLNPITGALVAMDIGVAPARPAAVAYDRSVAGTAATTLYAIDDVASALHVIGSPDGAPVSPNAGTTTLRGALGVSLDSDEVGFDITPVGEALATFSVGGTTGLYALDLASGLASAIGTVGTGTLDIIDIAALPKVAAGASQFTSVAPVRLLDTRQSGTKPGVDSTVEVQVTGVAGVPTTATAVVVNVTGTEATADGFMTVFPTGIARPTTSNNNLVANGTRATLVTSRLGTGGRLSIYVQNGAHVVVDVFGYYAPATGTSGRFTALAPARLVDTRDGGTKPGTDGQVQVQVAGRGGVPTTGVSAVVVDLTATDATAAGFVRAYATGTAPPATSNLNVWRTGGTASNLAVVPVGADGSITVYTQRGAHLVVDVAGWFGDVSSKGGYGGLFVPTTPSRVLDTRLAMGAPAAPVAAAGSIDVTIGGMGGVPVSGVSGVVLNLTAVEANGPGFVTVFPTGTARALVASLNVDAAGETVPNLVVSPLGTTGRITVFTQPGGHLVADVAGWYTA